MKMRNGETGFSPPARRARRSGRVLASLALIGSWVLPGELCASETDDAVVQVQTTTKASPPTDGAADDAHASLDGPSSTPASSYASGDKRRAGAVPSDDSNGTKLDVQPTGQRGGSARRVRLQDRTHDDASESATPLEADGENLVSQLGFASSRMHLMLRRARSTGPSSGVACMDELLSRMHATERRAERMLVLLREASARGDLRRAHQEHQRLEWVSRASHAISAEVGQCQVGPWSSGRADGTTIVMRVPILPNAVEYPTAAGDLRPTSEPE